VKFLQYDHKRDCPADGIASFKTSPLDVLAQVDLQLKKFGLEVVRYDIGGDAVLWTIDETELFEAIAYFGGSPLERSKGVPLKESKILARQTFEFFAAKKPLNPAFFVAAKSTPDGESVCFAIDHTGREYEGDAAHDFVEKLIAAAAKP
jgi:hypothetical protein